MQVIGRRVGVTELGRVKMVGRGQTVLPVVCHADVARRVEAPNVVQRARRWLAETGDGLAIVCASAWRVELIDDNHWRCCGGQGDTCCTWSSCASLHVRLWSCLRNGERTDVATRALPISLASEGNLSSAETVRTRDAAPAVSHAHDPPEWSPYSWHASRLA